MVIEDPNLRGWGQGYPNCQYGTIKTLVRSDGLRLPVRAEILPLVAWLIDETERRGYDVLIDETWGYNCRSIRGSTRPSNHSWGLAVDLNARSNAMQTGSPGWTAQRAAGRTDMPKWLPPLWKAHMFRWGGDYRTRQDPMHFEFMGSRADALRIVAGLPAELTPIKLTETLRQGSSGLRSKGRPSRSCGVSKGPCSRTKAGEAMGETSSLASSRCSTSA